MAEAMERVKTRPGGVVAVAVLMAASGVLTVLSSTPLLSTGAPPWAIALDVVIGLAMFVVAWGLYTLRTWAWIVTLGIQAVNGIFAIVTVATAPRVYAAWIAIAVAAVVIYYMTRPSVRYAFGMTERAI
jgi:hypothetical protein